MIQADVYAGDLNQDTGAARPRFRFVVEADRDANVVSRIAGIFDIANVAPLSMHLSVVDAITMRMSIVIELRNATVADSIFRKLSQLSCVTSVSIPAVAA